MLKSFCLLFLVLNTFCYSQTGGEAAFLILNSNTSARQNALGGKVLTLVDNINQPTYNPATISRDLDRRFAVNYNSFIGGISMGSASYAHYFDKTCKTFHANISYINYGTLIEADIDGNETGTFNASDLVFSVGYATQITNTDFHVGANIKYINSSIAGYSASGISIDLGVIYYNNQKPYVATLVVRNIGTQLTTYTGTSEKFPFEIALGGSYKLENMPLRWYTTLDNLQKWNVAVANPSNATTDLDGTVTEEEISFFDNAFRHLVIGAELFPESALNLRLGYNVRRGQELRVQNIRTFSGMSLGFGLKLNKFKLNYAYSRYHLASNTHTFSLEIDLNKEPKGKVPKRY